MKSRERKGTSLHTTTARQGESEWREAACYRQPRGESNTLGRVVACIHQDQQEIQMETKSCNRVSKSCSAKYDIFY
ncbi:hypothetical protein E2C01_083927 [Portunus trituberculatus]|uniref:Uncharacterized protein n=1 Tax=Portunus trituberculatus TaxID=210409 RepID=A0A5B7J2V9_PORTR|nr:hypothetical protein [Portunus trituberculatus]